MRRGIAEKTANAASAYHDVDGRRDAHIVEDDPRPRLLHDRGPAPSTIAMIAHNRLRFEHVRL